MSNVSVHPAATHAVQPSLPVLIAFGAVVVLLLAAWLLKAGQSGKTPTRKLDPKQVERARKRFVSAIDKRLAGKVEQYSVLLESRNMVNGFYEQKGQIVGVRFSVKQANCKRCKAMDGREFSLLEPDKVAAHTPPLHGEVRRGVYCTATWVPVRAAAERPTSAKR